jgi:GTP-binding protein
MYQNRRPKIFYATQVSAEPPTLVMFTSDPKAFGEPYRRYLLGALREHLSFAEVPIKLYLRKRQAGDKRAEIDSDAPEEAPRSEANPADSAIGG